jgi:hypothetical protein
LQLVTTNFGFAFLLKAAALADWGISSNKNIRDKAINKYGNRLFSFAFTGTSFLDIVSSS